MTSRASIFEEDDPLAPAPVPVRPTPEQVRAVADAATSFRSRESAPAMATPARRPPRTYRTGRTATFSVKARPDSIDAFYAIAERHNWKAAETFERALAALQRELAREA
jgi:hypothetical protein